MDKKVIVLIIFILIAVCGVIGFMILANQNQENNTNNSEKNLRESNLNKNQTQSSNDNNNQAVIENTNKENNEKSKNTSADKKIAVVYFSATGTTENVAKIIASTTNSDIIEIEPKEEYTSDDLNYNSDCRANREQNDDSARPEIKNKLEIDEYDTIYLGFPIWWGTNPKIILTLLDNYDLTGKNIYLFCTSGSSGIEESEKEIKEYNSNLNIISSRRFSANASENDIKEWLNN